MDRHAVFDTLCGILADYLDISGPEACAEQTLLIEDLGMGSMQFIQIAFEIERQFHLKIRHSFASTSWKNFVGEYATVGKLCDFITEHQDTKMHKLTNIS